MRLLYAFFLLVFLSTTSQAQHKASRISCEQALEFMVAQASDAPVDTSIYIFRKRRHADNVLRRLTDLALRSPRCPAALGARGLVKQRLARTKWVPKDVRGQRVGVSWKDDALYDLAQAAKAGGPTGAAATILAARLLHTTEVDRPSPVRETRPKPQISCKRALELMVAQAIGTSVDTSIYIFPDRNDADDVLWRLTDLALRSGRCPAALGARGLVKQRLTQTKWVPRDAPGQRIGVPWMDDALYDLALAAKAGGPTSVAAATVGSQLLLPTKVDRPYLVREVGPKLLSIPPAKSEIHDSIRYFHRGRLASWLWHPATADSAFSLYLAAGGSRHRAALELARVRLASYSSGADTLYYMAAASRDSATVRELRADLAFVADTQELSQFDKVPANGRPDWLRRFWEQRDLESLRPRGSRLHEHYARIRTAKLRFRLLSYPRRYELNELWINRDAEFDDRGLVYIRHGQPDETVEAVRVGACPNTSWLYRRPQGNLILHFVARQNPDDWRLVETLANVSGESGATTRLRQAGRETSCTPVDGLLESRMAIDPIYAKLAVNASRRNWERELAITTRSRQIGTTTDSDRLRFSAPLKVTWRAYGLLGTEPRRGRALVLISVAGDALKPHPKRPLAYPFRMRVVAQSGSHLVELDSTRSVGVSRAPHSTEMLSFTTEVPLESGVWNVAVALEQETDLAGEVLRDSLVPVPDLASRMPVLSDIVLGDVTGGRYWDAPDGPFPLSSTGSYVQGEPIPIYYEVAGATPRGELETEITLVRDDGKGRSVIRFNEQVDGPITRVRRELSTRRSQPGRYILTISVRTADNRRARREASLFVQEAK
jgi:GWxTD domain-containing protein